MRALITHAGLLVLALAIAYQTWTRDKTQQQMTDNISVWVKAPHNINTITYISYSKQQVHMKKRHDNNRAYWWATTNKGKSSPKHKTRESFSFPVGNLGNKIIDKVTPLKALRTLGVLSDEKKKEYNLHQNTAQLILGYTDKTRTVLIGDNVYGGGHRYILDPETNQGYVLDGSVIRPLESGESALKINQLLDFSISKLDNVLLLSEGATRLLIRNNTDKGPYGRALFAWADTATPTQTDQTLTDYMRRISRLRPEEFPHITQEQLMPILSVTYRDKQNKILETLVLAQQINTKRYFAKTSQTKVYAKIQTDIAQKIQDRTKAIVTKTITNKTPHQK